MSRKPHSSANPRRVVAGRRNRLLRGPLTPEGRERLRQAVMKTKPWLSSTGPRTAAGKARSAENGRKRQKGERSIRQLRDTVADIQLLLERMAASRRTVQSVIGD